jgi:hypothetical protein
MQQCLFEKLIFAHVVVIFPAFMKPEVSLPCSQELVTGPCPKLYVSSSHFHTILKINFSIIRPSTSVSPKRSLSLKYSDKNCVWGYWI